MEKNVWNIQNEKERKRKEVKNEWNAEMADLAFYYLFRI